MLAGRLRVGGRGVAGGIGGYPGFLTAFGGETRNIE